MSQTFTAVAHIYLQSEDYASVIAETDDIKIAVERDLLDPDINESMDIVEIVESEESPLPSGQIMQLRRARNILIRQRSKDTYEMARWLDEYIHAMALRVGPELSRGSYDYSNMMQVLKEVIDGGNPLDH